jgi:hypothetical protein
MELANFIEEHSLVSKDMGFTICDVFLETIKLIFFQKELELGDLVYSTFVVFGELSVPVDLTLL